MDCPRCGYVMSEFDVECPRCARLGAQARATATLPSRPARPSSPPPSTGRYPTYYLLVTIAVLFPAVGVAVGAIFLATAGSDPLKRTAGLHCCYAAGISIAAAALFWTIFLALIVPVIQRG